MADQTSSILVLTAILAVATVWLAMATQLMARATKDSVELDRIPYLAFTDVYFSFGQPPPGTPPGALPIIVGLGIVLRNPSKVRVKYMIKSIQMTLNSLTIPNQKFSSLGGYVFSGEKSIFHYGKIQIPSTPQFPIPGTAEFELEYFSSEKGQKTILHQKLDFTLFSISPFLYEYINSIEDYQP